MIGIALLVACGSSGVQTVGSFTVTPTEDGTGFDISHADAPLDVRGLTPFAGSASADVTAQFGSFRFDAVETTRASAAAYDRRSREGTLMYEVADEAGAFLGTLTFASPGDRFLVVEFAPTDASYVGFAADCSGDDHFLGLGSHAFDVDHVGEAFPLWTSEPGIGKSATDEYASDWYLTGTRHATSFPMPWALRPDRGQGLLLETTARVDVDLCATDPSTYSFGAWQSQSLPLLVVAGDDGLDAVRRLTEVTGRPALPEPWVFAPWNDAVRGPDRVRAVAAALRAAGAPSSVIWSEDWKGAEDRPQGYHLTGEWFLDETKYPDADALAAELENDGFQWFAYFSPFVTDDTLTWDDAVASDALIKQQDGSTYTFLGPTFETMSMVDLTTDTGRSWAQGYLTACLDHGFDGWMADYAEWLPTDAVLASGEDPWQVHNLLPLLWQQTNAEVMVDRDATFFVRSGWTGTGAVAPVVWLGDQRTSFDVDDGLPTVLPLALGLSAGGVAVTASDVAGYQSIGNAPTTRELFFRWASLSAYSPVLRTHHGAFASENVQFDTDADTLAHWAWAARENTRLWPYRYGLAAKAARDGTPMLIPIGLQFPGEDVARTDAWMLGSALLVAPVLEEGATGREVDLPGAVGWYDWHTGEAVQSGHFDAAEREIPVFAAAGTTIPTFTEIPDTLLANAGPDVRDLTDVDGARTIYLFGGGGAFTEADGTSYTVSGTATGRALGNATFASGSVEVGGVTLTIAGTIERDYTVVSEP